MYRIQDGQLPVQFKVSGLRCLGLESCRLRGLWVEGFAGCPVQSSV